MPQHQTKEILELRSFGQNLNVAVVGSSGGIGSALAHELESCTAVSSVIRLSRSDQLIDDKRPPRLRLDLEREKSVAEAAATVRGLMGELHIVLVATGILHLGNHLQPEKTWRKISASAMETAFRINAIGPALVAKHFLPLLAADRKTVFAAISARVGSIEDNRLGGWYAYRSSKAALNMLIKTLSIELARRNPNALCVGLHPGTVDTELSKPFRSNVAKEALFSPSRSAHHMLNVLDQLKPEDTGRIFAWDGSPIPY